MKGDCATFLDADSRRPECAQGVRRRLCERCFGHETSGREGRGHRGSFMRSGLTLRGPAVKSFESLKELS